MATQKEVKNRISSVKNIHKITRAMEMVAAARLRRAEQRIDRDAPLRAGDPQDDPAGRRGVRRRDPADRRCSRSASTERRVGIVLVTGDRGLAGAFNTNIIREGLRLKREFAAGGAEVAFSVVGRRGNSTMSFRGEDDRRTPTSGFTDRPAFTNAREISRDVTAAYVDEELDRVELVYNRYVSPLTQYVRRQTLLPLQEAEVFGEGIARARGAGRPGARRGAREGLLGLRAGARGAARRCCSRSTWTSRSTGRCSSRRPRSSARG